MNTITIARLSNGHVVMKGGVFDALNTASVFARRAYDSGEQVVRDATKEEDAFWLESLKNGTASVIEAPETTLAASTNTVK